MKKRAFFCYHFLDRLPGILGKAFTSVNIKSGWKRAGVYPADVETIMQRCTTWKQFSNDKAQEILSAVSKLTPEAKLTGEISDAKLQAAVGDAVDFEQWMVTRCEHYSTPKTPVEEQVLNRRRVIWVNHEAVTLDRREREAAKIDAARAKKADAEKRQIAKLEKVHEKEEKKRKREEEKAQRDAKKQKKAEAAAKKAAAREKKTKTERPGRRPVATPARYNE